MLVVTIWLSSQFSSNYTIRPLETKAVNRLESIGNRVELIAQKRPDSNLSLLLGRAGQRNRMALILVNARSREFIYGFPRGLSPQKAPFLSTIEQNIAYKISTENGVFDGPRQTIIDGQSYYLFAGKPLPKGLLRRLQRRHPGLLIGTALLLSTVLCALLAWSLVRPIRELQKGTQKMSAGELSTRVTIANKRGDELGQLARDFNQMTERVETLLGSQKRLVADISHELRSPLARLHLAIGIAQQQSENNISEVTNKQLIRVEKEAQQMERMIAQVLKLSKLETNVTETPKERISLPELLSELLNDAQFEAENLSKQLICEDVPNIDIDCYVELLASAVRNVVNNAIKYSSTKVQVSFLTESDTLFIKVVDDGAGVPESEIEQIFQPFYRLSTSRSRDSGGVGLGLAITQQAVALHNGMIEASNTAEGGLKVTIEVPLK